jgi:hypothetical protein
MDLLRSVLPKVMDRLLGRLRFPHLFLLTAALFLLDLLVPDLIPFADEILLGLATLLLGTWTDRREPRGDGRPAGARDGPVVDLPPDDG